jgi:hypothetical protein
VVLVDLATGTTLATLPSPVSASLGLRIGVAFSPVGSELVEIVQTVAGKTPLIIRRDISARGLVRAACRTAGRGITAAEWRAYVGTKPPDDLSCR